MRAWVVVVSMVLGTGVAFAQEAAQNEAGLDAEARALFDAGRVAFDEGRFENALEYFQRAYDLSHRHAMLYNIGTTHERLQHIAEAREAFEQYLIEVPNAPNRASVEARVRAMRNNARPTPGTSGGTDITPWIFTIAGAAITITGAIMLTIALIDQGALQNAPDGSVYRDLTDDIDRVKIFSGAGIVSIAVGAVMAGVGIVWALASGGGSSSSASLRIGPTSLALQGGFQ